jgi:hypothetical protein
VVCFQDSYAVRILWLTKNMKMLRVIRSPRGTSSASVCKLGALWPFQHLRSSIVVISHMNVNVSYVTDHLTVLFQLQRSGFFSPLHGVTAPSVSGFHDHTQTHHTRHHSSGRVISPTQGPLPDNTQQPQETDIHAPAEIRTRSPNKRTVADPRLRPLGHWDRHNQY